jgi:molybdopterin molybdotransferase
MAERREWEDPEQMLDVDEALERVLARFAPLPPVAVSIVESYELVTAQDIEAADPAPPFQNSAMDGFAIRSVDTASATAGEPTRLSVVSMIAAGSVSTRLIEAGQAARIMTGAPMPPGADTVVRFEEVEAETASILVRRPIRAHEHVRDVGEDVPTGGVVVRAGEQLGPSQLGLLASVNVPEVAVHRRPVVAILSTGDELVQPGRPRREGQIRDSNSFTLAGLVREAGGVPVLLGAATDSISDLERQLRTDFTPDLILTSGGVSIGDYDMVKDVLSAAGQIDLWQVRMKPGKPLAFGTLGDTPLLGLPGNPAASYVSFLEFGFPAIRRMLGFQHVTLPEISATLDEHLPNLGRRRHYVRGIVEPAEDGRYRARSTGRHGAALLSAVAEANCLIVIPETVEEAQRGTQVRVQLLDQAWRALLPLER